MLEGAEVRAARTDECEGLLNLFCAAFGMSPDAARPIFYADPFFDLSHKRVLWTSVQGIVSCLTLIPTTLRIGQAWVPLAGVAGVATHPRLRGRGYARCLLAGTVRALADELKYPLSGLFAHSEALYARLGWAVSSAPKCRRCPLSRLPAFDPCSPLTVSSGDFQPLRSEVERLAAASAESYTGGCRRDARRWQLVAAVPGLQAALARSATGMPLAYALWRLDDQMIQVLEAAAPSPQARGALMHALAAACPTGGGLEWAAPSAEWTAFGLPCDVPSIPLPGLMLRLNDLAAALHAVHAANFAPVLARSGTALTIRATDPVFPRNQSPVRLTPSGVEAGSAEDRHWIAAEIGPLAQVYLGHQTPSHAYHRGELAASSLEAVALADHLFPARTPFVAPLDQF